MITHKDVLRRLAADPKFIPGIYNYCDQWCDRCDFKHRCMNYVFERTIFSSPEDRHPAKPEFWRSISKTLQAVVELLRESAKDEGLEFDAMLRAINQRISSDSVSAQCEPECCDAALAYEESVELWLAAAAPELEGRTEDYKRAAELGFSGDSLMLEAGRLREALDVIRWHQCRIRVKLLRACAAARAEAASEVCAAARDSDGSAKVALLAVEHSMQAWTDLLPILPEQEDAVLERLVLLSQLRREIERLFSNARSFIRPGFDEV